MNSKNNDAIIQISAAAVVKTFSLVIVSLVVAHAIVMICWKTDLCGHLNPLFYTIGYQFDLSREQSIPNWFSATQLFLVALALGLVVLAERARGGRTGAWLGLVVIFTYMSLDEATDLHGLWPTGLEDVDLPNLSHQGFLWIIPGSLVVLTVAAIYLRWVLRLPAQTRNLFVLAGVVYVGGGLVLEAVGAFLADSSFLNTPYLLVSTAEETLEMFGVLIMLFAVLRHLNGQVVGVSVTK